MAYYQEMIQEQAKGIIFVTGGTGFVGSAVCRAALRKGFDVVCLSRSGPKAGQTGPKSSSETSPTIDYCVASINDTELWSRRLSDCVALVHCIGILFQNRSRGSIHSRVTVASARIAAQTAKAASVPVFALVSARSSPPPLANYSRAKKLAERGVQALYPDVLIFRPGILTGSEKTLMSPLSWLLPDAIAQDVNRFADTIIAAVAFKLYTAKN